MSHLDGKCIRWRYCTLDPGSHGEYWHFLEGATLVVYEMFPGGLLLKNALDDGGWPRWEILLRGNTSLCLKRRSRVHRCNPFYLFHH